MFMDGVVTDVNVRALENGECWVVREIKCKGLEKGKCMQSVGCGGSERLVSCLLMTESWWKI